MEFIKKHFIVLALLLLNIVIKVMYLSFQPISHDEPFSIYHAQFDFYNIIHYLKNYNNPPLFELILHFWIKCFGISPISVRLLPMLFSSLSVVLIYKIGVLIFEKRIAVISALLFTFSTFQIFYAHDCRVYTLFLFLTLCSFYLFFKSIKNYSLNNWRFISFIFVNSLIVYAHYFGFIVWLLQIGIILFFFRTNKIIFKSFILALFFSLVVYVPQLLILFQRFLDSSKNGTWLNEPNGIESIYNMLWSFCNVPVVTVLVIILFSLALGKYFKNIKSIKINIYTWQIIFWFVVPFILMFIISFKIPMFLDRYLIFITPAFYFLISLSIRFLFKSKIYFNLVSLILLVSFAFTTSYNPSKKRQIIESVNFIKKNKTDSTIIIVCPFDFITTLSYSYNQTFFKEIKQDNEYLDLDNNLKRDNVFCVNKIDSILINKINTFKKVIYFDAAADFAFPDNKIKETLDSNFYKLDNSYSDNLFKIFSYKIK